MITPVGTQPPKEKESAWDKISKVMGFAAMVPNVAGAIGGIGDAVSGIAQINDPKNVLARRLAGQAVGPKRTGITF